jgi:hypothetical protein
MRGLVMVKNKRKENEQVGIFHLAHNIFSIKLRKEWEEKSEMTLRRKL